MIDPQDKAGHEKTHAYGKWIVLSTVLTAVAALGTFLLQLGDRVNRGFGNKAPTHLMGWAGQAEADKAYEEIRDTLPKFHIVGDFKDDPKQTVKLWKFSTEILGHHLPTKLQPIGDCVAAGMAHAVEYRQLVQIFEQGLDKSAFKSIFPPYHYSTGRNLAECGNGRIRGPDGSVGAWQAKAVQIAGVLRADYPGLPNYDAATARQWATKLPDGVFLAEGKEHLVHTVAKVSTATEIRQAIQNGYPVTIASDWGGVMKPPATEGLLLNRKADRWNHQMCVIGYQYHGKLGPLYYVLNQWGPDAHGAPPDDAPPGGFWIKEKPDMEYIARQDCWAISSVVGFPAADWGNWRVFEANRSKSKLPMKGLENVPLFSIAF